MAEQEPNKREKLDWLPLYFQRLKASAAWKMMDFQCCWYGKLLIEAADSESPGYLPNDISVLWKLAGAKTERFFRNNGGPELLADHFNRTDDGLWIYNQRLLNVLHEQATKLTHKRRRRVSSLSVSLQELPSWIPGEPFLQWVEMRKSIHKPLTGNAIKLAYTKLERLKKEGHEPGAVLEQSIFRSWAGLFPLEQEKNGTGNNGTGQNQGVQAPVNGSKFAEEKCQICGGSGWDRSSGKAARCACWIANRKFHAAHGAAVGR